MPLFGVSALEAAVCKARTRAHTYTETHTDGARGKREMN